MQNHSTHLICKIILAIAILIACVPIPVQADGILIPEPPICIDPPCLHPSPMRQLVIRYHHVTVSIQDQVATTQVDQVFYNPNNTPIEGVYLFPIPVGATVTDFTLWIDGQPQAGQVLNAEQARQAYNEIVRELRDPALLEYTGSGAVKIQIFPIPAGGERRIELKYSQVLTAEGGLVRYVYPLSTEKFSVLPLENVSIHLKIQSNQPIRAIYSPSHPVDLQRPDDGQAIASYEANNVLPGTDFSLFYSIGESEAFHLLTYRDPGDTDPDGYFLLLLAPRPTTDSVIQPKDVLLVLDRSGSMEGEKFQQAQAALRFILKHLGAEDRFNIITFSTSLEAYASSLRPADEASQAIKWVDQRTALGSTDINRALLEAAGQVNPEKPTYLIFLTDGLPTTGVIERQAILDNFRSASRDNLRLFAFGVGYDVDTYLLDTLAQEHHGASQYVQPGQHLDEIISGFYERISAPVLTDLRLDFGGLPVYDLYPSSLPDLFRGSQIVVTGRYRQGGTGDVLLTGVLNGLQQTFTYKEQKFADNLPYVTDNQLSAIPRIWATRKIGYLLNQLRLLTTEQDEARREMIEQIVRLSIRFGIVTPYTSYLVTDPAPLGESEQARIAGESYDQQQSQAPAPASGQGAVQKSVEQSALSAAQAPATIDSTTDMAGAGNEVRQVGARTFVRLGSRTTSTPGAALSPWIDTDYDPEKMQTVKVVFLSDEYFRLAADNTDLAAAFALGEQVIALSAGVAYEVIPTTGLPPTTTSTAKQPIDIATPGQKVATLLPAFTPVAPTKIPGTSQNSLYIIGLAILGGLLAGWVSIAWTRKNR